MHRLESEKIAADTRLREYLSLVTKNKNGLHLTLVEFRQCCCQSRFWLSNIEHMTFLYILMPIQWANKDTWHKINILGVTTYMFECIKHNKFSHFKKYTHGTKQRSATCRVKIYMSTHWLHGNCASTLLRWDLVRTQMHTLNHT